MITLFCVVVLLYVAMFVIPMALHQHEQRLARASREAEEEASTQLTRGS